MGDFLYHYTSEKGADGIKDSGFINTSTDTTHDAVAGEGVYLTSKPPSTSDTDLLRNNYDGGSRLPQGKVDTCFKIPRDALPDAERVPGSRDVWVNPGPVDLTETPHQVVKRK